MTFGVLVKIAGYLWFFEPLEKMNRSLLPPSFFFFVCFLFGFCFVFLFFCFFLPSSSDSVGAFGSSLLILSFPCGFLGLDL